jgi:hypothetical protein
MHCGSGSASAVRVASGNGDYNRPVASLARPCRPFLLAKRQEAGLGLDILAKAW